VQSSSQTITTNKPTPSLFTGQMPFLLPNQQCQSTVGKIAVQLLAGTKMLLRTTALQKDELAYAK